MTTNTKPEDCPKGMAPFNLKAAQGGAEVITRDGVKVSYVECQSWDEYPILASIGGGTPHCFTLGGTFFKCTTQHKYDLFMVLKTPTVPKGLLPFDLEGALKGEKVVNRAGEKVTIERLERLVGGGEAVIRYAGSGDFYDCVFTVCAKGFDTDMKGADTEFDIFMAPKTKKVFLWARSRTLYIDTEQTDSATKRPHWSLSLSGYTTPAPTEPLGFLEVPVGAAA